MPSTVLRLLGRLYSSLAALVVAALLVGATVAAWHFYQDARLHARLAQGQLVTVRVARADRQRRQVWDALGSFVYVSFRYKGRPYEVRCAAPPRWLDAGDPLELQYAPGLDVFGQPRTAPPSRRDPGMSRLIDWSVLPDFSPEAQALLLLVLAAGALFFVGSGLLASLTGLRFFSALARPVGVVALAAAAGFCTYDAARYYRYGAALRRDGRPVTVAVLRAAQHAERQTARSHDFPLNTYTYTATFRYADQEREVAVAEADYDRIRAGDRRLTVGYDAARNDFMAAGYSLRWLPLLLPLFLWGLLGWALWPAARPPVVEPART